MGDYAYFGFELEAEFWYDEHGLQVVYHPTKSTFYEDGTAIVSISDADNDGVA